MNKKEFIKKLSEKLNISEEKCEIINGIIEDTFIIGKTNKEKMIDKFKEKLNVKKEEAEEIYESSMEIIAKEVKNKLKNPFKNLD